METKQHIEILDKVRIDAKLKRMAYQIWELYSGEKDIILIGIKDTGLIIARALQTILNEIVPELDVELHAINLNKKSPLASAIQLDVDLNNKNVVLIDDVANSGKTLLYALKPVLDFTPASITIAVLVDRTHKVFPISPDIIGHSIATTLKEHIEVVTADNQVQSVILH